jgi:hypothetical protein
MLRPKKVNKGQIMQVPVDNGNDVGYLIVMQSYCRIFSKGMT